MTSSDDALFNVEGLRVTYGRSVAVEDVSLEIPRGSIRSVIGVNGAGKSSTLRAIAGLADSIGTVTFDGRDLTGARVDDIVAAGIALVPEGRRLFGGMTVLENLRLGAYRWTGRRSSGKDAWTQELDRVFDFLPELKDRTQQRAGSLSGGQQQMLAIGRALMSRPSLLMLDEPCTGLAPIIVTRLAEMIRRAADEGMTILLIEQNAQIALELSAYCYVMETGRIVLEDDTNTLATTDYVREVYLGV